MPNQRESLHSSSAFFSPSSPALHHDTRIVDFSGSGDEPYEPGARFESPGSSPATPSFTFTSFSSSPASSPNPNTSSSSESYTIYPTTSQATRVPLPTILPIPFPASSSSSSPKLPAYSSKLPRDLRVDSSPTSPQRPLPSSTSQSLFHSLLLRTVPHSLLPKSVTHPSPFQYPKSPSLLRAHPTTRHRKTGWKNWVALPKRWIVTIVFLIVLIAGLSTLENTISIVPSREWLDRARETETWRRLSAGTQMNVGNESIETVNYLERMESVRNQMVGGKDIKINHHSSPGTREEEEEQAVLNSVVAEAEKVQSEEEGATKPTTAADSSAHDNVVKPKQGKAVAAKPKKDPSRYKRLLPLKGPSRRYLYGANFIPSSSDEQHQLGSGESAAVVEIEVEDPEYSNKKKIKVPSKKTLERLYQENKKTYEEEEQGWRDFEWKAPEVDESLTRFIEYLSPEELSLRTWIQQFHSLPVASGVGLGSSSSSSSLSTSFPSLDAAASLSSALVASIPHFNGEGNQEKYDSLISQAREGFEGKCRGSNWLESYQKMHKEMLEGKRDPKFISYHCEKGMNCGGLGDRLLGMTSAFFFGLLTQRSFLGEWQSPIPLDVVFDSPSVNWSYSSFTSPRHPVLGQQTLIDQSAELDIIHFDRLSVDSTFGSTSWNPKRDKSWTKGFEKRDIAYASSWIKFFTNRGMIYRSFSYKHLQKSINKLGLKPTTAFACINQYLFRPKPPALNLISEYTSVLTLPSVFSVGIHVRTGDRSMKDREYDKINTVKRHSQFFRCARELGETYASPSQQIVYYLVTDSAHLKVDAQRTLGSKLVTTNMVPQHVHQKAGHVDGVFSAVVEDWILSKTDMMVATQDSGFGKLASFMHGKENTTVTIFPRFNEDVNGLVSKKSHLKVDCTDPNVFTTFEELSSEWSLG
ncbi:uncharacterized protein JCM6883_002523 [Sporobolomyces salmoneus]|uniref:uncharacterized protein n=1 Tax=Sporobolomyces salmoneus TaxID=183962 RepID=UPI00316DCB91